MIEAALVTRRTRRAREPSVCTAARTGRRKKDSPSSWRRTKRANKPTSSMLALTSRFLTPRHHLNKGITALRVFIANSCVTGRGRIHPDKTRGKSGSLKLRRTQNGTEIETNKLLLAGFHCVNRSLVGRFICGYDRGPGRQ